MDPVSEHEVQTKLQRFSRRASLKKLFLMSSSMQRALWLNLLVRIFQVFFSSSQYWTRLLGSRSGPGGSPPTSRSILLFERILATCKKKRKALTSISQAPLGTIKTLKVHIISSFYQLLHSQTQGGFHLFVIFFYVVAQSITTSLWSKRIFNLSQCQGHRCHKILVYNLFITEIPLQSG